MEHGVHTKRSAGPRALAFGCLLAIVAACGGTSPPGAQGVPAAPTNVTATPGPGYIQVSWTDNSDNETGFRVYRSSAGVASANASTPVLVGETSADETMLIDASVQAAENYAYSVTAVGEGGASAPSAATPGTSVPSGVTLVAGTFDLGAVGSAPQAALLMYFHLASEHLPAEGEVAVLNVRDPGDTVIAERSLTRDDLLAGWRWDATPSEAAAGTYTLSVTSGSQTFTSTYVLDDLDTTMPVAADVAATSASTTTVEVGWGAVAGAQSYQALLHDAPVRSGAPVFSVRATTSTQATMEGLSLTPGSYYVALFAFPTDITLSKPLLPERFDISLAVSAPFVPSAPGDAPNAPSNVQAASGPGFITVTWTDESLDETGFNIYRDVAASSLLAPQASQLVGSVGPNVTTFKDVDIDLEQAYVYLVTAMGQGSESAGVASGAAAVPAGVDLVIGTFARDDNTSKVGTSTLMYFHFPSEGLSAQDVSVSITGPPGWNGGEAFTPTFEEAWITTGWATRSSFPASAVGGVYTLTVTIAGGPTYQANATLLNPTYRFPQPSGLEVTAASPTAVSGRWNAVPQAVSYSGGVWTEGYGSLLGAFPWAGTPEATIDGLSLPVGTYVLGVAAWPIDQSGPPPDKLEPFGFGFADLRLVIGSDGSSCVEGDVIGMHPALAGAIETELGLASDPTCLDVASVTEIHAHDAGIGDLQGLQFALSLGWLDIPGNEIDEADLDAIDITRLPNLFSLGLDGNRLTTLDPLSGFASLGHLWVGDNLLDDAGIAALADPSLAQLEGISLWGNDLTSYAPLSNLTNLKLAFIGGFGTRDVTPLHGLTGLEMLHLNDNGLRSEDVGFLSTFTNLVELSLTHNEISDLSFLETLPNLEVLSLQMNAVIDIQPLVDNSGLGAGDTIDLTENFLDLSGGDPDAANVGILEGRGTTVLTDPQRGAISSLCADPFEAVFFGDPDLRAEIQLVLGISGDPTCYDMARVDHIHVWDRGDIDLLDGLEYAVNLEVLNANDNLVSDLTPLAPAAKLVHLGIGGNPIDDSAISALDWSTFASLDELNVSATQVTDFSFLASIPVLKALHVCCNDLATNGTGFLADHTDLEVLVASSNGLADADLAILTSYASLEYLDIGDNPVANPGALVLGKPAMTGLALGGMGLTDLTWITDPDFVSDLASLHVPGNALTDLQPLADYTGWDAGDYVNLAGNPLDLSPGSDASVVIADLRSRGVSVDTE